MLDERKCFAWGLALFIIGVIFSADYEGDNMYILNLFDMMSIGGFVLFVLSFGVKRVSLPRKMAGPFKGEESINEIYRLYEKEPEFRQAADYMLHMTPEQFRKFVRVVADLRYEHDQSALRSLSALLRRRGAGA